MAIRYKVNMLEALKKAGYNTYRLKKDRILGEGTIQALRRGKAISFESLSRICKMLNCQPGDILEYDDAGGEA